jgi:hypothetical protein
MKIVIYHSSFFQRNPFNENSYIAFFKETHLRKYLYIILPSFKEPFNKIVSYISFFLLSKNPSTK